MILVLFNCEKAEINESEMMVPKTVVDDPSLPSIYVNATQLHSEAFGNPANPMIVCLHDGPGGDYRSMLNLKGFADDGFYVVFYDQRGCGLSQRHDAEENVFSLQQFIYDLDAVIYHYQSIDTQHVFLAGHDWGAILATAYINQYPDKISGLILSEPKGLEQYSNTISSNNKSLVKDHLESSNQNSFKRLIKFVDSHELYDYELMINGNSEEDFNNPGEVPFWRFGSVCKNELTEYLNHNDIDITSNLDQYYTKVFICYSELSRNFSEEQAIKAAEVFTNVEIIKIANCGHCIPYEGWNEYYPKTMDYLNEVIK